MNPSVAIAMGKDSENSIGSCDQGYWQRSAPGHKLETMGVGNTGGVLSGLRVLELGHFVAAPFCTRLLGDLGADVIKIEPPTGDPVREWGDHVNGHSLWWSMHGRNKRCIVLDLKKPKAISLTLELAKKCDVLVENFRPGQLARLGLGDPALRAANSGLVIAHISGYGQDGPYRDRAAFGLIGEAVGGLRHLTNHAHGVSDLPPVRVGVSIGDSIAGLYGAFGVMAAVWKRDRAGGHGVTPSLDVALTESVLSMMEGILPEYGAFGRIRQPSGSSLSTAAPSNAYKSSDDQWVLIGANSEPLFARLVTLMGQPALTSDPRFMGNRERVRHATDIDAIIGRWTVTQTASALITLLTDVDIPCTKVYTAADCANDPQFRHRGMVRHVEDPVFGPRATTVLHAGIVPHIPENPGQIRWPGPAIGAHTADVLSEMLGCSEEELQSLRNEKVIR